MRTEFLVFVFGGGRGGGDGLVVFGFCFLVGGRGGGLVFGAAEGRMRTGVFGVGGGGGKGAAFCVGWLCGEGERGVSGGWGGGE